MVSRTLLEWCKLWKCRHGRWLKQTFIWPNIDKRTNCLTNFIKNTSTKQIKSNILLKIVVMNPLHDFNYRHETDTPSCRNCNIKTKENQDNNLVIEKYQLIYILCVKLWQINEKCDTILYYYAFVWQIDIVVNKRLKFMLY